MPKAAASRASSATSAERITVFDGMHARLMQVPPIISARRRGTSATPAL
jgi:hypothetical protein